MKASVLALSFLAGMLGFGLLVGGGRQAVAEVNYPWCLIMGGNDGSWNCGFVTLEQCRQTRIGRDMCVPNPRYSPNQKPVR